MAYWYAQTGYAIRCGNKVAAGMLPNAKVVVTYSDSAHHQGTVYVATNAIFQGGVFCGGMLCHRACQQSSGVQVGALISLMSFSQASALKAKVAPVAPTTVF